jgi:hypothetical protein
MNGVGRRTILGRTIWLFGVVGATWMIAGCDSSVPEERVVHFGPTVDVEVRRVPVRNLDHRREASPDAGVVEAQPPSTSPHSTVPPGVPSVLGVERKLEEVREVRRRRPPRRSTSSDQRMRQLPVRVESSVPELQGGYRPDTDSPVSVSKPRNRTKAPATLPPTGRARDVVVPLDPPPRRSTEIPVRVDPPPIDLPPNPAKRGSDPPPRKSGVGP